MADTVSPSLANSLAIVIDIIIICMVLTNNKDGEELILCMQVCQSNKDFCYKINDISYIATLSN